MTTARMIAISRQFIRAVFLLEAAAPPTYLSPKEPRAAQLGNLDDLYSRGYTLITYELRSTAQFDKWVSNLTDRSIKNRLLARLARAENGNLGDFKQIETNLYEFRCFFGGGLRIYFTIRDGRIILLLAGGDKTTQARDIKKAIALLNDLKE